MSLHIDETAHVFIAKGNQQQPLTGGVAVACCHDYTVWVEKGDHTYLVKSYPNGWTVNADGDKAFGHADNGAHSMHFHGGIIVANNPPVADADGPYQACAGQAVTFDGSGSYDSDPGDTPQYRWDFDSDGIYNTGWSDSPYVTWNKPNSRRN